MRPAIAAIGLLLTGLLAACPARAETLGLVAGEASGTETMLASDMASLFTPDQELGVRSMLGDCGIGNIALLLDDPSVDIAFVSADALAEAEAARGQPLADKLELVARLYPQELHVLARREIATLGDLAGKKVNFGPRGSGSEAAAIALFKALAIPVQPVALDQATALQSLKQGSIAASILIGGKPVPFVGAIHADDGIRLLPITFNASLESAYLPTALTHDDYPGLIATGNDVTTVATSVVLLAAKGKSDDSAARVARFIAFGFPGFAGLATREHHPKWREINLAASWPGLNRVAAAENWLERAPAASASTVTPVLANSAGIGNQDSLSNEDKEALFKEFMQWRAKGH